MPARLKNQTIREIKSIFNKFHSFTYFLNSFKTEFSKTNYSRISSQAQRMVITWNFEWEVDGERKLP
jgi:hypothetical protein